MDVPAVIELLLSRMNTRGQFVGGAFAAFGGTAGNMQMFQRDAVKAINVWHGSQDTSGLVQLASTMQAYGNLTDAEYAQIIQVLDGDN